MSNPNRRPGTEDLDESDFPMPRVKMVQNTSRIEGMPDASPGTFVDASGLVDLGKVVNVVVLKVSKFRALYWDAKDPLNAAGKTGLRCKSSDGHTPNQSVEYPLAGKCADCDFKFKDLHYRLLCMDVKRSVDVGLPVVFEHVVKGTSLDPIKKYIGAIVQRDKAPMEFSVDFKAAKADKGKGVYYVLQCENVKPLDSMGDTAAMAKSAYETYAAKLVDDESAPAVDVGDEAMPF